MKKLLLIAAMAAIAFGASADGYKIEKVWEITDVSFLTKNDTRQGFGMNGKFYINCKTEKTDTLEDGTVLYTVPTVYEIDENGLTGVTFEGGHNCGITRDEAGNIVVSDAQFPGVWGETASIKVINPETGDVVVYTVPEECAVTGRSDMLGFAKGNLFEDGELYIDAAGNEGVSRLAIVGGEVSVDDCYLATCDGLTHTSSNVVNYYTDLNGEEALLFVYRSGSPQKLLPDGDNYVATGLSLPSKGFSNGAFPFIYDGKEMFVYPGKTSPNYLDGFSVGVAGDTIPLVEVESTVAAPLNGFQCNWLNAEVDQDGVTIYQYYPHGYIAVWRMTKDETSTSLRGDVNADGAVDISDVTALIDALLTANYEVIDAVAADCTLDGSIDISDVTALIDYLLTNAWPE